MDNYNIKKINELRDEVEVWIKENGSCGLLGPIPNRSCWECNGAHEGLKNADYPIQCFECWNIFYKGTKLTDFDENGNDRMIPEVKE